MAEAFTWLDGERLIRFRRGGMAEAHSLVGERGLAPYTLLTTERAQAVAPDLAAGAADVLHVPPGEVPEAAAAVRARVGGRAVVALGGGRVIDAGKAIAGADGLRCAAVPTTLSGAELTRIHRMPAGVERFAPVRPELVVADAALMASQPMPDLAASAMNALGHALEALYVPGRNPVAELAALRAAELIASALEPAEPDRDALALGALLAGYALGATGYAVHHVVSQTLVRVAGTPHAETNAVMLPHSIRLMEPRAPDAIASLAAALARGSGAGRGSERPASDLAPGATPPSAGPALAAAELAAALAARAGPTTLSQLGVAPETLDAVVEQALARPQLASTPRPPDAAELRALLEAAL